jgi:hypothetical protein
MSAVPTEFADLLSARGRRVLDGRMPSLAGVLKTGQRFVSATGLLDAAKSRAVLAALEEHVAPHLTLMEAPIPPESIWGVERNYAELLPKTVRVHTVTMASRSKGARALERSGVQRLLTSRSFARFAEGLSGRAVRRGWGTQVLAYGAGDYAGPHHDHHPEEPLARDGYTDVHLTFCTRGVRAQSLVYAPLGHFSEQADVATLGGVTAYRLPFWHYTTPLLARPDARGAARRWVLLGTFLDAARARYGSASRAPPRR